MMIIKAIAVLLLNFILYMAFGSFFTVRKDKEWSLAVTVAVGFFAYYALFAVFCLPIMLTYRPLSLLAHIWTVPCVVIVALSAIRYRTQWIEKFRSRFRDFENNRLYYIAVMAITIGAVALVVTTYNFTLDAAYYVASVTTNVDTNMINVYDPFTGAWQDHFELRYAFATYYVADSVMCSLTSLPALVETKTVMSATVILIVNLLYVFISRCFFDDRKRALLMYVFMTAVNCLFISIYTTSNFLMTRTYEGKTIVGNISVVMLFVLYMLLARNEGDENRLFLILFIVCLGTATVSSTANMVIPAGVFLLFTVHAILRKDLKMLVKTFLCVVPELMMMLVYVLYVKGYFAIYTYPR